MLGDRRDRVRQRECLLRGGLPVLLALCVPLVAFAASPVELASGLESPTALAYAPGPKGGFRLIAAEAAGGVTEFTMLAGRVLSRRVLSGNGSEAVLGLASYKDRTVVLSAEGGVLLDGVGRSIPLARSNEAAAAGVWIGPPAISERWLLVPAREGLLRCRLESGDVMGLRRMGPPALAVACTPTGYLATLETATYDGCCLAYRDPEKPREAIALYPIEELARPTALAVRPSDSTLYALETGRLFRLDVAFRDGRPLAVATPLDTPGGLTALAFGPDSALYATTEAGTLIRLEDPL